MATIGAIVVQGGLENAGFWRKGTLDGVGRTLAAPVEVVRRTTPIHGKIPGKKPCRLRRPKCGSCRKRSAAEKGSLCQTHKKNTEANTKVYDLNQKTMQALSNLALVYARFEGTGADFGGRAASRRHAYSNGRTCRCSTTSGTFRRRTEAHPRSPGHCLYRTQQASRPSCVPWIGGCRARRPSR